MHRDEAKNKDSAKIATKQRIPYQFKSSNFLLLKCELFP